MQLWTVIPAGVTFITLALPCPTSLLLLSLLLSGTKM
jgi:hypothetical protein